MDEVKVITKDEEKEKVLNNQVSDVEYNAERLVIMNEEDFNLAGEFAKKIKAAQKEVKSYWEPLRVSTKEAYDKVLERKKTMLDPLVNAEKIVKNKISKYAYEEQM